MIHRLAEEVRTAWAAIAPGAPAPARLQVAKWSFDPAPDPHSLLVFFVFAKGFETPVAMAKASRTVATDTCIATEYANLQWATCRLPPELAAAVPRPIATGVANERPFLLTTVVPGKLEAHYLLPAARARGRTLAAALNWCMDTARATRSGSISLAEWLPWVADPLAALAAIDAGTGLRHGLAPRLAKLWTRPWPAGGTHGDFFAGNVLFEHDRCSGVVDWTLASERGPIMHDVSTYEFSIGISAIRRGLTWSTTEAASVAELPAFKASRRRLRDEGVECDLGSDARLAVLTASILRDERLAPGRKRTRAAQLEMLGFELDARR